MNDGGPYDNPTLHDAQVARDAYDDAMATLERFATTPQQVRLYETLLEAVEVRYRTSWWHLVARLAELFPGVGPAIREIAEDTETRIDANTFPRP